MFIPFCPDDIQKCTKYFWTVSTDLAKCGTNQPTPRSWVLLEKPPVTQPLKKFPTFYGTRNFIAVFTRALRWSSSRTNWIHSIPTHPISLRSILILSCHLRLGPPSGLFPSGFATELEHRPPFCWWRPGSSGCKGVWTGRWTDFGSPELGSCFVTASPDRISEETTSSYGRLATTRLLVWCAIQAVWAELCVGRSHLTSFWGHWYTSSFIFVWFTFLVVHIYWGK
jgi:hypothetical protein